MLLHSQKYVDLNNHSFAADRLRFTRVKVDQSIRKASYNSER